MKHVLTPSILLLTAALAAPVEAQTAEVAFNPVQNYCTSLPNSTGVPARIAFSGSPNILLNNAAVVAYECPPSVFGFFVVGQSAVQFPYGDGYLCINPYQDFYRLTPVALTTHTGGCPRPIDYNLMPMLIDPGSTWNFQFIYRDLMGPAKFNTTDAVRVSFY